MSSFSLPSKPSSQTTQISSPEQPFFDALAVVVSFSYVSTAMLFDKYHGLGNDFVIVELDDPAEFDRERAKQICDRNFGVGGDGVLLLSPSPCARARMTVVNADGSVPEMCGNGLRCAALHLVRQSNETQAKFEVDTDAGPLVCEIERSADVAQVKISLGKATRLPPLRFERPGREALEFARVSMGNPHAITFSHTLDSVEVDRVGPSVSAQVPGGANVEFAEQLANGDIKVVVWERGVGRTLACGTGAGATALAAIDAGLCEFGAPTRVHLPGGVLEITVTDSLAVSLAGPARRVFSGELA